MSSVHRLVFKCWGSGTHNSTVNLLSGGGTGVHTMATVDKLGSGRRGVGVDGGGRANAHNSHSEFVVLKESQWNRQFQSVLERTDR